MKKCPYCAEEIQDDAVVCRFCKSNLQPVPSPTNNIQQASKAQTNRYSYNFLMSNCTNKKSMCFTALYISLFVSIGLFITVFSLNGLELLQIYNIGGISPISSVEKLIVFMITDWRKFNLPIEVSASFGILTMACIVMIILLAIIIVYIVKGIINVSKDPVESLRCFKNVTLVNTIINFGSLALVLIWNSYIHITVSNEANELLADILEKIVGLRIPYNAIIFGILGIIGVVAINKLQLNCCKIDTPVTRNIYNK